MNETIHYVCKVCGAIVPADLVDLSAHSLTHGRILVPKENS